MTQHDPAIVDQFLRERIDTVPHLEALLLLWNSHPKTWPVEDVAKALFLAREAAESILDNLVRQGLIAIAGGECETYRYEPEQQRDRLIRSVDLTYRRELIRVSRMIHSKPPAALREFAGAFRFKKDE